MSVTSIQLIGLFVVMMNGASGLHILLPHFPGTIYAEHTSVIQFSSAQISSMSWPNVKPCVDDTSLLCAPIDLETITFSGAVDPPPPDVTGNIPRLRCCCASMTDIQTKYKDPKATDKVAAHIFVDKGVAEAIAASNSRVDTWLTMHSTGTGITVTGDTGKTTFNIVFKPGAQFSIKNDLPPTTPTHFLAYYLMGVGSSKCTSVPSDGPPCAPRATNCVLPRASSRSLTKSSVSKSTKGARTLHGTGRLTESIDMDCSNTHWP
jgi:hypothetical protein